MSFLLVIVATIFLLSGLFLTKDLPLIFVSIGCSALAGLVLVVAVLRSRPRPAATPEGVQAGEIPSGPAVVTPQAPAAPREAETGRFAGRAFPIPDYDRLEVVEVLPLLGDLEPPELEMVRQREASGRAHPWVLARIDALLESEAVTGEHEWAPAAGATEVEEEWEEPASEWATPRSASEWAASDFPLEGDREADYGDIEVMREFPIDRYHELRANEILPLLSQLDFEDLKMVREEEAASKGRTSILSRIDTLLVRQVSPTGGPAPAPRPAKAAKKGPSKAALALPIENYDNLTVAQINVQLGRLSAAELKQVRTYEKRHKARAGVLQKIEAALLRAR